MLNITDGVYVLQMWRYCCILKKFESFKAVLVIHLVPISQIFKATGHKSWTVLRIMIKTIFICKTVKTFGYYWSKNNSLKITPCCLANWFKHWEFWMSSRLKIERKEIEFEICKLECQAERKVKMSNLGLGRQAWAVVFYYLLFLNLDVI